MNAAHAQHGVRWRLVGPWYRWPRPGLPEDGLQSAPALQKFAGNDFVPQFLKKPQHSLQYDEVIDVVQEHDLISAKVGGKIAALFALDAEGKPAGKNPVGDVFRARPAPGTVRKLYQPTHDRHYLVTCELHCEEAGFPRVARQQVCQSGFVVRRRSIRRPTGLTAGDVEAQARLVRFAEAEFLELRTLAASASTEEPSEDVRRNALALLNSRAVSKGFASGAAWLADARAKLNATRAAFVQWQQQQGIEVKVEGWFPQPGGQRGEWKELVDAQAQLADITSGEQTYPLLPLVPDPREKEHDGAGRTMYWGTVPTQDLQLDPQGQPHFDHHATYEIRCFVRAHHDCPPRAGRQPDCNGRIVWSRATEAFRVAAAFDVLGSANRPVTIQMPDLRDLAAQAALRPRGKLSPVRFVQPQHLSPTGIGGPAICSFSIPLITIVALFVLNIFLPIVVFLLQLWFLLLFRFCIVPQFSATMKLDAALAAMPAVNFDASLQLEVDGELKAIADLRDLLTNPGSVEVTLEDRINEDSGPQDESVELGGQSTAALASMAQSYADNKAIGEAEDARPPETGEPLVYEPDVTPVWRPGSKT